MPYLLPHARLAISTQSIIFVKNVIEVVEDALTAVCSSDQLRCCRSILLKDPGIWPLCIVAEDSENAAETSNLVNDFDVFTPSLLTISDCPMRELN
jgi:hypothetical protein